MIGSLRGRVKALGPDLALIEVGGVGYSVRIALPTFYKLDAVWRADTPDDVSLLVHTHVRDDALELFGFDSAQEKALFEKLIAVSGIGPRLAQVILSGMPPEEVLGALASSNIAKLTRIPGVGKKTAERMILELRDKARELMETDPESVAPELPSSAERDVIEALLNLGYRAKEAERAVAAASEEEPSQAFQELLRRSLKRLSRA